MSDSYQTIIDTLSRCTRILMTTHVRPDGDALGSTGALALALAKKGIESEIVLLSHLPSKYAFLFDNPSIQHFEIERGLSLDRYDAFLVADTGTWSQLPGLKELVTTWNVPKLVIDHHLTQENWATAKLVETDAAATGEIVEELLLKWDIEIEPAIATCLFVALVSDTGWFQFSNTRPRTMRLAARLMECGVDTDRVYQLLYQSERPQRIALQTRAMQSLQLLKNNRIAVMHLTKQDFEQTQAGVPATENLINIPLQVGSVEVAVMVVEPPEGGPIRVSLRSKGQLDCARFAEQFGGGGHARAAGLKLQGSCSEVRDRVVDRLLSALNG